MLSSRTPSQETSSPGPTTSSGAKEREENTDVQGGRISIFLHKRDDQMSHDVIQPLLRSACTHMHRDASFPQGCHFSQSSDSDFSETTLTKNKKQ